MIERALSELLLDVGNSRMKLGLFLGGRLVEPRRAAPGDGAAVRAILGNSVPHHIGIGSVGASDPAFLEMLRGLAPVTEFTGASPAPVRLRYSDPSTLGVDRLANVVGAATVFQGRAVLAIDLGTCVTYDLVDELAVHRGGIISPGLRMRSRAMHAYSARLPEVSPAEDAPLLGTDTATSLAAGVHQGLLMELLGFVRNFRQQHEGLVVVLTGGDAPRFARAMKSGIFAHPTLTLLGLHALLHFDPNGRPVDPA